MIAEVKKINDVMLVELVGSLDVSLQSNMKDKLIKVFSENQNGDVVLDFQ
jgi:anti-anti-sigma regulatory factor